MQKFQIRIGTILLGLALLAGCAQNDQSAGEDQAEVAGKEENARDEASPGLSTQMEQKVYNKGETFQAMGLNWTVNGTKSNARFKKEGGSSTTLSGKEAGGGEGPGDAILVSVSVENTGNAPQSISRDAFRLEDMAGRTYQPSANGQALFNLKELSVFEGVTVMGHEPPTILTVVFEVPDDQDYYLLIYAGEGPAKKVLLERY